MAKVFISHSSKDKPFVDKLSKDLLAEGHQVWLDAWEIRVGECIPTKISEGLASSNFVIAVLSPNAVNSNWFDREWKTKYWDEVNKNDVSILPVLIEDCSIPELLKTKKYADFKNDYGYGLKELLHALINLSSTDRQKGDVLSRKQNSTVASKSKKSEFTATSLAKILLFIALLLTIIYFIVDYYSSTSGKAPVIHNDHFAQPN